MNNRSRNIHKAIKKNYNFFEEDSKIFYFTNGLSDNDFEKALIKIKEKFSVNTLDRLSEKFE